MTERAGLLGLSALAAGLLVGATAVIALAEVAIVARSGTSLTGSVSGTIAGDVGLAVAVVSFSVVGFLLIVKRAGGSVGSICLVIGIGGATLGFTTVFASAGLASGNAGDRAVITAGWISGWLWVPVMGLVAALLLVFPDGRLPSPRWRVAARAIGIGLVALTLMTAFRPGPLDPPLEELENPLSIDAVSSLYPAYRILGFGIVPVIVVALGALIVRFRRSQGIERAQLKWFAAAAIGFTTLAGTASILYGAEVPRALEDLLLLLVMLSMAALPVAIGIAVLRYRLYEIDRIISRTVGYAIVTGTLAVVFVGVVLGLQTMLARFTGGNTVAVAASTLVVAALFQPLRGRVQRIVDRRFDRARYDGQRIVDEFARQLRDEVDMERLRASLLATANEAVRPIDAGVWLRGRTGTPQ